ncbi:proline dipeptidase [Spirochaetia bacterium]|nr:proline dipeptidase [Spirochaetia bacterium]
MNAKIKKIIDKMKEEGIDNLIICDGGSIYYLTGCMFHTMHRMCALLLSVDSDPVLYIHEMFPTRGLEEAGVRTHHWKDTDNYIKELYNEFDHTKQLAVDKYFEARFVIALQDFGLAKPIKVGSYVIDDIRAIKSPEEFHLMDLSSDINDKAMLELEDYIDKYHGDPEALTELHLVDVLAKIYAQYTDGGFSFDPIISFGVNATDPHHEPDNTVLKAGDCVIIDIGCMKDEYASDMTRTVFYKKVSDFDKAIFEIVCEAQRRAEAFAKPGVKCSEIDAAARNYITEKGYGQYFTHRLGHFIGMEVHEAGDISGSNHAIVKAGNVFSIEPGIYIAEKKIGVRCENLVFVTEDGSRPLNKIPMGLKIVG